MKFNVIGGLPRSGSTLLCNILNQNPKFHASSTSMITPVLNTMSNMLSKSTEIKGELQKDRKKTEERMRQLLRGVVEGWYKDYDVVFDKCRGWRQTSL